MQKIIVLSGAGVSAESGIRTFRDAGGLWEQYPVMEVASLDGWKRNPQRVLQFYNERRQQAALANPNEGHQGLAELEQKFEVHIITQNVDALHEKAGSTRVLHLHGELRKARSCGDPSLVYDIGDKPIHWGDTCEKGFQLRPHIVWFGEPVPAMEQAIAITKTADVFVVVGTSLNVYPAAGLIDFVPDETKVFIIDPENIPIPSSRRVTHFKMKASEGVARLKEILLLNPIP